jgi:hypothetical protein
MALTKETTEMRASLNKLQRNFAEAAWGDVEDLEAMGSIGYNA